MAFARRNGRNALLADPGVEPDEDLSGLAMTYLSADERAAIQAALPLGRGARARRAEALVNPASGLANDYLNLFNEIVMLVEHLPTMPELFADIERWSPISYQDYFRRSVLPGRESAIEAYDRLDRAFRRDFESVVAELDRRSTGAVAAVRRHVRTKGEREPAVLTALCTRAGSTIREALEQATQLVNHGELLSDDVVQNRTDMLFARIGMSAGE